jgi:hypothetical protein
MPKLLELPDELHLARLSYGFLDDFTHLVTGDLWTDTSGDSGASAAVADGVKGVVALVTGATDNNEAYLHQTAETFKFADDKPLIFEALVQFAEANTDDANVMVGLKDAWAADSILDDGAGPAASYSGAVFFKVDGGTRWNVEYSNGATQETAELTAANSLDGIAKTAGGAAYQRLRIEFQPHGTVGDVKFFIDDQHVYTFANVSYSSATDMEAGFGVKAGGANSETLNVDYAYARQKR